MRPTPLVLVATVRGLKAHSGNHKIVAGKPLPEDILKANPDEVHQGGDNLRKQLENMKVHGVTPVVAINAFPRTTTKTSKPSPRSPTNTAPGPPLATHFADGGAGAATLAEAVSEAAQEESNFKVLYEDDIPLRDKIHAVATKVYGADDVEYSAQANRELDRYEAAGFGNLPVCIAKTTCRSRRMHHSRGAPTGWTLPVRESTSIGRRVGSCTHFVATCAPCPAWARFRPRPASTLMKTARLLA